MPCKIYLRHDQSRSQQATSKSEDVIVYAPSWVKEGLNILAAKLKGVEFTVLERPLLKRGKNSNEPKPTLQTPLERFVVTKDFNNGSLVLLQKIARNEPRNTTGRVNTSYYQPDISDVILIYSIKDLARQSIIVGKDRTTFCGGYKFPRVKQNEPVYICDLAALQFQQPWNSGRLVLIQESNAFKFKGPLDDFIFENVVGEKKKSYKEVSTLILQDRELTKRYLKHDGFGKPGSGQGSCFMDAVVYQRFVKLDVILSGLVLAEVASKKKDQLNFKFLKYGTGYFAGKFSKQLDSLILEAVVDGMEELFEKYEETVTGVIKCLSFPFYDCYPESKRRLDNLKQRRKVEYNFLRMDALKPSGDLVTACTNCANSYVACGNTMGQSTDGTIAKNLASKGNIFCPNLNSQMKYKYVEIL